MWASLAVAGLCGLPSYKFGKSTTVAPPYKDVISEVLIKSIVVGIARAGSDKTVVKADYLSGLKSYEFGEIPHVVVVPCELHFLEKEALVKIAQAPEGI